MAGTKRKKTKKANYKCLTCGVVLTFQNGMWGHLKKFHSQKMISGKTYVFTSRKQNRKTEKATTTEKNISRHKPPANIPQTSYIDVRTIIRIPITLGQVKIIAQE